jgi:hypothetical protein
LSKDGVQILFTISSSGLLGFAEDVDSEDSSCRVYIGVKRCSSNVFRIALTNVVWGSLSCCNLNLASDQSQFCPKKKYKRMNAASLLQFPEHGAQDTLRRHRVSLSRKKI